MAKYDKNILRSILFAALPLLPFLFLILALIVAIIHVKFYWL